MAFTWTIIHRSGYFAWAENYDIDKILKTKQTVTFCGDQCVGAKRDTNECLAAPVDDVNYSSVVQVLLTRMW
jgi:hypothetical protein